MSEMQTMELTREISYTQIKHYATTLHYITLHFGIHISLTYHFFLWEMCILREQKTVIYIEGVPALDAVVQFCMV
jgi:hypothetical protein